MAKAPTPRFTTIGKGKFVHVIYTEAYDRKHSQCMTVRKNMVAGKIDYSKKHKGLSPEAALSIDQCSQCATHEVAKAMLPAESKRAAAKDKRDETLARARASTQSKAEQKKRAVKAQAQTWYLSTDGRGWTTDPKQALLDDEGNPMQSRQARKMPKPKAAPRKREPKATKTGPRSVGSSTEDKAKALVVFAQEHGWGAELVDADPGIAVVAIRGNETIRCTFVDGKYDTSRHAYVEVGDWRGKLRGVHGCRAQMAAEGRDRPHPEPGKGRKGPRKKMAEDEPVESESPEDAAKRVPFSIDDDPLVIIDAIKGKTIRWRNGVSGTLDEATVPSEAIGKKINGKPSKRAKIEIKEHPKTGKRMVSFLVVDGMGEHGEVYGPERTIYLDRIVRVIG